jgi:5'-deoxynucleotidase YfbR-like HD superfamily hydrolase
METYTGKQFFILNPTLDSIDIVDIAHSLSMQCRYNGHTQKFYSVAEHSCILHDYALEQLDDDKLAFEILLHDASEAYMCDIPRPLKLELPDYQAIERSIEALIAQKFGLEYPHPQAIKDLDTRILRDERLQIMSKSGHVWNNDKYEPLGVDIHGWLPKKAEKEFMYRFTAWDKFKK